MLEARRVKDEGLEVGWILLTQDYRQGEPLWGPDAEAGDSCVQDTETAVVSGKSVCGLQAQGTDTLKEPQTG